MSVTAQLSDSGQALVLKILGRFDFSIHQDFRNAYEKHQGPVNSYIIDLKDASYIDSSALGMLLLLRDYAGGDKTPISIVGSNPDVKKILIISNFNQLFKIE